MKLNKTEIILLIICIGFMLPCFIFNQKELGGVFAFFIIFILMPKGSLKSISLFKFECYPVEPNVFNLITESPEWIKLHLNIKEINISEIPLYLSLTLKKTLTLTSPFSYDKKVSVSNLENFKKYSKLGYYGFTTIDASLESQYGALLQFFDLLQNCKFITHTSNDTLDKILPTFKATLLPHLLNEQDDEEMDRYKDCTIQEYLNTVKHEITYQNKYYTITKKYPEFNESEYWSFWEIQRADFSRSDCEEIFVLCYYHSAGTFNFYYPLLIRKIAGRYDTVDIEYSLGFIEKIINFVQFDIFKFRLFLTGHIARFKIYLKQLYNKLFKK